MIGSSKFGLSLVAIGVAGLSALLVVPACGSSEQSGPGGSGSGSGGGSSGGSSSGGSSSGAYCGTKGTACCAAAGQIPNPECDDGDETLCTTPTTCPIAEPQCGSTSTCEPLTTNTAATQNFRMRRLIVVAPPALASSAVQTLVVNGGVDMNEKQCGETQTGDFSWLLSLDTAGNMLTTGGAPPCDLTNTPSCDPFNNGYCFVNKNVNGIQIGPIKSPVTKAADGTYSTAIIPSLNIPIYFGTPTTIITLPISNGSMTGIKISPDGNCIGSVNTKAIQPDCTDSYTNCSKWLTDASMTGFITLAQADKVHVSLLNETLCVLLSSEKNPVVAPGTGFKSCVVDANGNPTEKGNYCSSPAGAGGCADSYWLAATFAASAVKINDGTGVADCTGGTGPTDAAAE